MKAKLDRVDRASGPLVVGRFYLVPTVHTTWKGKLADWPVIGPEHDDREFFQFSTHHYHVDARFLPAKSKRVDETLMYPLHAQKPLLGGPEIPLPKPVWRRRICVRASFQFEPWDPRIDKMRAHFAGTQCARNAGGWVCPHRQAPLGSIVPVDGVIVCPLHGLWIDAVTGVCLEQPR